MFRSLLAFLFPTRYEARALLRGYINIQYGPFLKKNPYYASESFYQNIISEATPFIQEHTVALDIGCATGRLVFEWEKLGSRKSIGIDSSNQFIEYCLRARGGREDFRPLQNSQAEFVVGDVFTYQFQASSVDFVSCVNVLDRVEDPQKLVRVLLDIVKPGGVLLMVDPYDWELSPTPSHKRVPDMKLLFEKDFWSIEKEIRNIAYTIPLGFGEERTYACHLVILKKL